MEHTAQTSTLRGYYGYIALLLSGFTFWFILGYPFQHHNESYIWAVHLENVTFAQSVFQKMVPVANHRPLGQAVAWLTYRLSDGSVAPAQVFNFAGAIAAWILAFWIMKERRVFALVALVVGGVLFSGYIYIFHLHGVFYSAVLVYLVLLVRVFEDGGGKQYIPAMSIGAVLAAFFHPYALLMFLAAAGGAIVKGWKEFPRSLKFVYIAAILIAVVLIFVLVLLPGNDYPAPPEARLAGFISSYQATEVHPAISAVIVILTLLTATAGSRGRVRNGLVAGALVALVILLAIKLPLILAWIAVCIATSLISKRYSLAFLVALTAVLPVPAPTGSPTYVIYVTMLCAIVLATGRVNLEKRLTALGEWPALMVFAAAVICAFLLRSGVNIPIATKLVTPVIAERERTEQLVEILQWWRQSPYAGMRVFLAREALNPVEMENPGDRQYRPPTSQRFLVQYINHRWKDVTPTPPDMPHITVAFGGEDVPHAEVVHEVPKMYAGSARVMVQRNQ